MEDIYCTYAGQPFSRNVYNLSFKMTRRKIPIFRNSAAAATFSKVGPKNTHHIHGIYVEMEKVFVL